MGITQAEYTMLSSLEKKVVDWLTKNKVLFATQEPLFGGTMELGGTVIDILLAERNIVLRIFGGYWHSGITAKARDELSKERLMNQGYIVIDLWESSLSDDRIEETMRMALRGEEQLK